MAALCLSSSASQMLLYLCQMSNLENSMLPCNFSIAFSCLTHASTVSPSFLEHGYGLHLIEVGASGRTLIVMFGLRFGGKRLESSSENTLQCRLNCFGIVSIVICVRFISSRRLHSCARFVRLRNATSFLGSRPVSFRVSSARLKNLFRFRNFVLCSDTVPPWSFPSLQLIRGLNSRRKGVAKDHSIFSQRRQEESLKLLFSVVKNPEPAVMCDFTPFVFCAIDVMHRDGFIKFLSSNSQSLPGSETDEVLGCSTVQEGGLFGRCTRSVYRNRKIDHIHLFNVHSAHTYCPQPGRWLWAI